MQAVLSLTNKYIDYERRRLPDQPNETYIFSAFWTGEESIIYIEAYDETLVRRVVEGMTLFLSGYRNAFRLIDISDRTLLFEIQQKNKPIPLNGFVRPRTGIYKGDLAQVVRLIEEEQRVVVRLVPRLDLRELSGGSYSAKSVRPPQKLFDPSKVPDRYERQNYSRFGKSPGGVWYIGGMFFKYNRDYFRGGMLYKEFAIADLIQNTIASPEEKVMFANRNTVDVEDIYESNGNEPIPREQEEVPRNVPRIFFKGDTVKIISGELKNLEGVIEEADTTRQEVQVNVSVGDDVETLILKENEIMKVFTIGTHVKVIAGQHSGETGHIVLLDEDSSENGGSAILMSDYGDKEIKVFVNYLIVSGEVSRGLVIVDGFELYDLVSVGDVVRPHR